MSEIIPTVRICSDNEGGYVVINQIDFLPGEHTLYEEEAPAEAEAAPVAPPAPVGALDVASMDKAAILAEAERLGIRLDGRLSEAKLRSALADLLSEEK